MVLNPLTNVGVRMFVAIRISRGQFMMNVLGHGKRRQAHHHANHPHRDPKAE